MGEIARRTLKGYSYQQSIFTLFLAFMDTERIISKIVVETLDTKNFDDIFLEDVQYEGTDSRAYRIQVKNYPCAELRDIKISKNVLSIDGNKNEFEPTDNNIFVINTKLIETDDNFMGLPCTKMDGIIIIPLTPEQVADRMDNMFDMESRELQIIHKADDITENAKFEITINNLPEIIQMSIDLENETVLLRNVPDNFEHSITFIEGKPGVGKSHFVNEIYEKYPDAVVYRFWIGSQDPNRNERIRFKKFLSEMGIKIYKSAKKVYIDELVEAIKRDDRLIIIDGLDHVENYNPHELEDFIKFIEKLSDIRVVVLSRPLKKEIEWNKDNLLDWNFDEARLYLEMAHGIVEYEIQDKIFHVTGGYPIITYFISEDYKINHVLDIEQPIEGINEYYDTLFIGQDRPSEAIGVFATGNCFFTWKELGLFFSDPEMYEVIRQFIELHPYLFKQLINRVSLIHDSFNTYLRTKINSFSQRQKKVISIIRSSILDGSIEYMDRMQSFCFDEEFYTILLKRYSDFDEFKNLMMSTRDYNSIQSLYIQLQRILEDRKGILDLYQYYSFALLFQIANRNDLIGTNRWVLQMLVYMNKHGGIEDNLFSSDYIWQVYLACKNSEKLAAQYLANRHFSDSQFYDLIEDVNDEIAFYEKKNRVIKYEDVVKALDNDENRMVDKDSILIDYLVSVWIHGNKEDKFYNDFIGYIQGDRKCISKIQKELFQYSFDEFWISTSLESAEYQLHELGYFGEANIFRNTSLLNLILKEAAKGSYTVVKLVASYIKLANYEKRDIDIENLAYSWAMYFNHKDYSVYTIDEALITFEHQGLISENNSFDIIQKLMAQSDDGISHLMTSYANKKGVEYVKKINEQGYFLNRDCRIRFWELNSAIYNCFRKEDIVMQVTELLSYNYFSKDIDGKEIQAIMESKYKKLVLDGIKYYGYSIFSPGSELIPVLEERGIKYFDSDEQEKEEYVPLHYGHIHKEDYEYIAKQNIDYLEIAEYTDGWDSCLPFVDVFSLYDKEYIQRDCVEIVHRAMFARRTGREYLGMWSHLVGNIPALFLRCEADVDWEKLYSIFKDFLEISLIWYGEH